MHLYLISSQFDSSSCFYYTSQKAHLSWCDRTEEKFFQIWSDFKENQKMRRYQLAGEFNERRLLAKSFANWEASSSHTKTILCQVLQKFSGRRKRFLFTHWLSRTRRERADRASKEQQAVHFGERLCLLIALQQWRSGASVSKKESEMIEMIERKKKQVYSWLSEL